MPNYKIYTIDNDVEDVHKIVQLNKNKKITLFGHSTGCQIALIYLKSHGSSQISSVILQAPCSDVEYEEHLN
jgi:alpha-beta hydrolase superfamily lysophospholipase